MTFCEANVINLNDISKCSIRINSILHKFTNYSYFIYRITMGPIYSRSEKLKYILLFAHSKSNLAAPNLLTFGKAKKNFAFRSLNRKFATRKQDLK